jgi:hypothetical protein
MSLAIASELVAAGLGYMCTHMFRHSYRIWIDAIGNLRGRLHGGYA